MKSKGNMYGFVETWNPLAGKCSHKCSYCYRTKMMRFPKIKTKYEGNPRIDYSKSGIVKNLGKGKYWFVGSMTDIFAKDVKADDIWQIINHTNKYPKNTYLFQTKNPHRFNEFVFSDNHILCITAETNRKTMERLQDFYFVIHPRKMITIEPIMDFDLKKFIDAIKTIHPMQINIGADSGHNNLPEPPKEKILELIAELEKFTKVYQKSNLKRILNG